MQPPSTVNIATNVFCDSIITAILSTLALASATTGGANTVVIVRCRSSEAYQLDRLYIATMVIVFTYSLTMAALSMAVFFSRYADSIYISRIGMMEIFSSVFENLVLTVPSREFTALEQNSHPDYIRPARNHMPNLCGFRRQSSSFTYNSL